MTKKTAHPAAELSPQYLPIDREFAEYGTNPQKVALIYNAAPDATGDAAVPSQDETFVAHECQALRDLGHEVVSYGISYKNYRGLKSIDTDFVFNGCEGSGLDGDPGVEIILALERRVVPFSGLGSRPYHLTTDKLAMKAALAEARIPVPAGAAFSHHAAPLPAQLRYPLFVKPRYGFGSIGVDARSRVNDEFQCREAVERVVQTTGVDALVEEFVEGREITVGIIGSGSRVMVLPPLEVQFGSAYRDKPLVRMYDTKMNVDSPLYWDFRTVCPAPLSPEIMSRVERTALGAYQAVGGDGYGRVDIRLSPDGVPYVLEVNGNPSIEFAEDEHDSGMMPLIARALGWSYRDLLARIVGAGMLRSLRRYRFPLLAMRRVDGQVIPSAAVAVRKGALVAPVGTVQTAHEIYEAEHVLYDAFGRPLLMEPHLRFLAASSTPNLIIQKARNRLWLVAARGIREGEPLTVDRTQIIELAQPLSVPAEIPVLRARRRLRY